ncbi:uncharacterized protein EI90DRAFT_3062085 [Cantharellus anzutake]|uniref:uncharacterized protein n=1 Tax=Cantharellus anzutake TaxID=1750568 RepID=UPI001906D3BD|nr:uncharacterized protein EI90DRAFT_3104593 [Cantharellus anzutake]XP_038915141.1 uncharacterized protein EI90DRAFT_3062085 [Cantharellus anzutake]KAF8309532.1 hypothetical protein EI90DRAFT_3104593 [Cantharellus anzutake]KAF8329811.1 hypothetical protein EI90DRAFT_3062085 [Cantharellus anzutake]
MTRSETHRSFSDCRPGFESDLPPPPSYLSWGIQASLRSITTIQPFSLSHICACDF